MKAWLISWVAPGDAAAVEDEVAAILNPVYSKEEVRKIVALMYRLRTDGFGGLASWAVDDHPTKHIPVDDRDFMQHLGTGPLLEARIVTNLRAEQDESSGMEALSWTEPYGAERRVIRRITGPLSGKGIWDRSKGGFKAGWGPGETPMPSDPD